MKYPRHRKARSHYLRSNSKTHQFMPVKAMVQRPQVAPLMKTYLRNYKAISSIQQYAILRARPGQRLNINTTHTAESSIWMVVCTAFETSKSTWRWTRLRTEERESENQAQSHGDDSKRNGKYVLPNNN